MPKIAVVVLNWNGAHDSIECIKSLLSQTIVPSIILIDNASIDGSVSTLKSFIDTYKIKDINLIENKKNNGYAGGINTGFKYAIKQGFEFVAVLNPDATADKMWLERLYGNLKSKDIGITTGLLLDRGGKTIDSTGEIYSSWGIPSPRGRDKLISNAPKEGEFVFGATGGASMYRVAALKKVGLFDESFFMYFEDVDISFRFQLAGYKVYFEPLAVAYHAHGTSAQKVRGLTVVQTFKNLPMLFLKNVPFSLWGTILPRFILAYNLIFLRAIFRGKGLYALKGWFMNIILLLNTLRQRKYIQSQKNVSTDYIKSIILHDIPSDQVGLRKFRSILTGRK